MRDRAAARQILSHCDAVARFSEDLPNITRPFLSGAARSCISYLTDWMKALGMQVRTDAAGNLRGVYPGTHADSGRVVIGSHLDSVPNAGRYDGVLGVVLAVSLIEQLKGERFPFAIEVVGFSEEEGVRFGLPFIGSRALIGDLDARTLQIADASGVTVEGAIWNFGLDPDGLPQAVVDPDAWGYLEFHIEQGPVLDDLGLPLGVVETIAGQSRMRVKFLGQANHAGTTPMHLRRDALCAAAQWITLVEAHARSMQGLVATVGAADLKPGASNAVPGEVVLSLDVRHASDAVRSSAVEALNEEGRRIAEERGLQFMSEALMSQPAVPMDVELTARVERAIQAIGVKPHRMMSGAGHDAMIVARKVPSAMIFLRSPGGISHHPDEEVREEDVGLALQAGLHLLRDLSEWRSNI